nr:MAG TPA: hypothetical protein [Inoviridae sp.]
MNRYCTKKGLAISSPFSVREKIRTPDTLVRSYQVLSLLHI